MAVVYEWIVEEMDDEEIEDVLCFDTYAEAREAGYHGDMIALRKMKSRDDNGTETLDYMAWAYVKADVLPEIFDDGSAVPKRFLKEFASPDHGKGK
jgi:hypothetical protein